MPARLLVVADPKMLPALANGLRDGGRFEVTPLPYADLAAVQAASAAADALALFYGSADRPLAAALQQLAPALRERGARVVAVLQKDQAAQRDDCFRAGASDVLFMPMPKDQFVSRLSDAVALAFTGETGQGAQVSVATRSATHKLEAAAVLPGGVLAPTGPELKAGDTVRLAWSGAGASFQAWGLVVRSDGQGARIRLAGMAPEEEARLREWLKGAPVASQPPPAQSWSSAPTAADTPKVYPPTVAEAPAIAAKVYPATVAEAPAMPAQPPPALAAAPAPTALPQPPEPGLLGAGARDTVVSVPAFPPAAGAPAAAGSEAAALGIAGPSPGVRGVPTAGPPPGFAARPPIRPQSGRGSSRPGTSPVLAPASRANNSGGPAAGAVSVPTPPSLAPTPPAQPAVAPPASAQPGDAAPAAAPAGAAAAPAGTTVPPAAAGAAPPAGAAPAAGAAPPPAAPAAPPAAGTPEAALGLASSLFDDVGGVPAPTTAAGAEAAAGPPAAGPPWPVAVDPAATRSWLAVMLKERNLPPEAGPEFSAALLKVAGGLSSGEREALDKAGPESHLYEALLARAALALASSAGTKLYGVQPPAVVDQVQVSALTQLADAASKRLQGEADKAIAKGEVESLQMVTAASAALSREQLSFKETVDRLRGLAAAPRMGAGALDPDVQLPGQAPRAVARAQPEKEQQRRLELKDFQGLQASTSSARNRRLLIAGSILFVVSALNALWWSHPGAKPASAQLIEKAGVGVLNIAIADAVASVRVTKGWYTSPARKENLNRLCEALASRGVRRGILMLDGASTIGYVELPMCRPMGLAPPPGPPPEPGAPPVPGK